MGEGVEEREEKVRERVISNVSPRGLTFTR